MARFDSQIAMALRLIKKNGQLVQWRIMPDATPNPDQPWKPSPLVPEDKLAIICFLPMTGSFKQLLAYIKGTEVKTSSVYGLMGAVDYELNTKDVVVRDGDIYDISSIDTLSPNGQKILHTIEFKA